jgi:alpha-tubulin suppressor-like RCC1 family protein
MISLGTSHTVCVNNKSKIFAWGWNEASQCAKNPYEYETVEMGVNSKSLLVFPSGLSLEEEEMGHSAYTNTPQIGRIH